MILRVEVWNDTHLQDVICEQSLDLSFNELTCHKDIEIIWPTQTNWLILGVMETDLLPYKPTKEGHSR